MNNKIILITGSSGFIGKYLMNWIQEKFPDAILYGTIRTVPAKDGQEVINLKDRDKVKQLINKIQPNYIFHLAGVIHSNNWDDFYEGNVRTTINILEAVKDINLSAKVIVVGSAAEYGNVQPTELPLTEDRLANPMSLYGISKSCQTQIAHYYSNLGLNVIVARLFNVYGPGISQQLSIGTFLSQISMIASGKALPQLFTGNLSAKRDFLYIDDACSGLVCLAEQGMNGEIYNICSEKSVSMDWIVEKMLKTAGLEVKILRDPNRYKPVDVPDIFGCCRKIAKLCGWSASVSLEDGIVRMMAQNE